MLGRVATRVLVFSAALAFAAAQTAGVAAARPAVPPSAPTLIALHSPPLLASTIVGSRSYQLRVGTSRCTSSTHATATIRNCMIVAPLHLSGAERTALLQPQTFSPSFVSFPTWCNTSGTAFSIDRTDSCGVFSGVLTYTETVNGVTTVITVDYDIIDYTFTSTSIGNFDQEIGMREVSSTAPITVEVSGTFSCAPNCTTGLSSWSTQTLTTGTDIEGVGQNRTTISAAGAVGASTPTFTYTMIANGTPSNPLAESNLDVRCDNATPGNVQVGCVFDELPDGYVYSLSGSWPQLAAHIHDAQQSGLPGSSSSGAPLTRTTNKAIQTANRNTACPASLPRPAGDSCDEYPFASTLQGASRAGAGPRTFAGCQVTLKHPGPTTGAKGYSVCMINASQNSQGGGALGNWQTGERIINNEGFYVDISN